MFSIKEAKKIKAGLKHCEEVCLYENDIECPYRVNGLVCNRKELMVNALNYIKYLEDEIKDRDTRFDVIRKTVCGELYEQCKDCL